MSKSITGNGSLNLTLNELRLLEIKSSNIESTNATISNALTVQGTLTANNFSITGTFTLTNLEATGLIDAFNVDVENQLLYKTEDTDDRYIRKSGSVNETISGTKTFSNNVICNSSVATNELKGLNNVSIYARAGSDFAYAEKLNINVTNSTFYNDVIVGTTSNNENLTVYGNGIVSGGVVAGAVATTGALTKNSINVLNQTENDARYIQLSTTDFSITNMTLSGFVKLSNPLTETTISTDQKIMFLDTDNKLTTNADFTFKPDTKTLKVPKIEATLSTTNIRCLSGLSEGRIDFDSGSIFDHHPGDVYLGMIGSKSDIGYQVAFWNTGETRHRANTRYRWYIQDNVTSSTFYEIMRLDVAGQQIYGRQEIFDYDDNSRRLQIENDSSPNNDGVFYTHPTAHIFRIGSSSPYVDKLKIGNTKTTIYNDVDIGESGDSKNLVVHGTSTFNSDIEMPQNVNFGSSLISGGGNRMMRIPYLDIANSDTANRKMRIEGTFTYNPSSDTMHVGNIILTGDIKSPLSTVDPSVTDSFPLVFLNTNSTALKKVSNTVDGYYNQSDNQFGMKNLTIVTELKYKNQDIDSRYIQTGTDQIITNKYTFTKLNLDALPIMYTELIESDDTLTLHSSYDSSNPSNSTAAGRWGNGNGNDVYMSFKYNDTGVTHSQFSPSHHTSTTYSKWLWETQLTAQGVPITYIIDDSYFGQYFYLYNNGTDSSNLNGSCWQIDISMRFRNNSSNRVAPSAILIREVANGTKTEYPCSEGTGYIRTGLAKFHTVRLNVLVDNCQTTDKFYIKLTCARGSASTFTSILNVNDWRIQYYKQQFTYKGNMTSGTTTNPRTVELSGGGG